MNTAASADVRRMQIRQFVQLYLAAAAFTLVPYLLAWAVPKYLAYRGARESTEAARAALMEGELDAALEFTSAVLRLDSESEVARGIRASAYAERYWANKTQSDLTAGRALLASIESSHESAALTARGNFALIDEQSERAIAFFHRAVEADKGDAYAEHQLGYALTQAERNAEALAHFKRALELNPEMAWLQNNIQSVLVELDRCAEKIAGFSSASAAGCHNTLGLQRFREGEFASARQYFEAASRLDPESGLYHANLASALFNTGETAAGRQHVERARALGLERHPAFSFVADR